MKNGCAENEKLYSIGGTWIEIAQHVPIEIAFGGYFKTGQREQPKGFERFKGRLTEDTGVISIIEGGKDNSRGILEFDKTYVDTGNRPRRAPIHYLLMKQEGELGELWKGSFVLHAVERAVMTEIGFDPSGIVLCRIALIKDKASNIRTLDQVPNNFDDLKMRIIFGPSYPNL